MRCTNNMMNEHNGMCMDNACACPDEVTKKCCCLCGEKQGCINICTFLTNKPLPVKIK